MIGIGNLLGIDILSPSTILFPHQNKRDRIWVDTRSMISAFDIHEPAFQSHFFLVMRVFVSFEVWN